MKPIYFPFTFISEPILNALTDFFGKVVIYQGSKANIPEEMKEWEKSGKIEIRIPISGDEEKIEKILQDFKTWTDHHQGSEFSLLKTQAGKIPFFNGNATSQIMWDLKSQDLKKSSPEEPDLLLNARLFLQIAQELDLQEDALRQDLLTVAAKEKNFIKDLRGDVDFPQMDPAPYPSVATRDTGHYMTRERVEAWARIMQHDHQQTDLFVTSSRSVMEHILDEAPETKILTDIDGMAALETLITDPTPTSTQASSPASASVFMEKNSKSTFTLYLVSGCSPQQFFARYVAPTDRLPQEKKPTKSGRNTLIGWYDI